LDPAEQADEIIRHR